ncbi:MAG: TIGR01841 family phasin [Azospirillaceae bacterium]
MTTPATPRKPAAGKAASAKSTATKSARSAPKRPTVEAKAPKAESVKAEDVKAENVKAQNAEAETVKAGTVKTGTVMAGSAPAEAVAAKVEEKVATVQAAAAETVKQAEAAMADVKNRFDEAAAQRQAEVETAVKAGHEAVAWNLEQGMTMGKDQFEQATGQFFTAFDEAQTRMREGMDAMVSAGQAWNKGVEEIAQSIYATQQAMLEDSLEAMKALLGAKTISDVVDLQSSYTRQTLDGVVSESMKLSELAMKVANDATQPISSQVNKAMEGAAKAS